MKLILLAIIIAFVSSCTGDKDVLNKIIEVDNIQIVYPFVDLKSCEIINSKDSLTVEINFKDLAREIEYDNPNLGRGYPEYCIQGSTVVDSLTRLLFHISYNNNDTIKKVLKKKPIAEFIKDNCKRYVAKEVKSSEKSYDLYIIDTMPNISIDSKKITFKISKKELDVKISSETIVSSFKNNLSLYVFYDKPRKGCHVIYYHDFLEAPLKRFTYEDRGVDSSSCK